LSAELAHDRDRFDDIRAWVVEQWWSPLPAAFLSCLMHLEHVALIVEDYDTAIEFFVEKLGFELVEDSPALTNDGRPKRWVVVRPPNTQTGLLLARADGESQSQAVGKQFAGRVGLFLRVDEFDVAYRRMRSSGVKFVTDPRTDDYGQVAVFLDVSGNRWDLLGPTSTET
jgi:catechol 2,3-dioxygenase-like lactoylglutathione lyase family enzyme